MSGQPDAIQYEKLVEKLLELDQRGSSSEMDALTTSYYALSAVIGFLLDDARIRERGATRSLGRLLFAVLDRTQGARPKLLFGPRGAKGAPSHTSAVPLRILVNASFLTLCEGGMSKEKAANWLAAELKRNGIKQPTGKEISAREIIRWRAEMGAKSLKGSDEAFAWFVHGAQRAMLEKAGAVQLSETSLDQLQAAQLAARVFIRLLWVVGF
jgi:hypothetical protein